jgi:glycosyltransferase involved in cell wall biosynthesis
MNDNTPLFSVVLPCYNRAGMLNRAIQSLLGQEFDDWELIIVDDGSTDDSKAVVEQYSDNRIRYVWQENAERGAARNTGIRQSKGKFLSFLDSDDYLLSNHLAVAASFINSNSDVQVFHLNYEFRDVEGNLISAARNFTDELNKLLLRENVISCNGIFLERSVVDRFKFSELRDLSGTEDYELWLRLASVYPIRHMNTVTSVVVQHPGRSMEESDVSKIEKRILAFLRLALADKSVREFLGQDSNSFEADRISYISLHASLVGNKRLAKFYLKSYISKSPSMLFSKRTLLILFNLIRKTPVV